MWIFRTVLDGDRNNNADEKYNDDERYDSDKNNRNWGMVWNRSFFEDMVMVVCTAYCGGVCHSQRS